MLRLRGKYWYAVLKMDGRKRWICLKTEKESEAEALIEEIREQYQKRKRKDTIARLLGHKPRNQKPLPVSAVPLKVAAVFPSFSESGMKLFRHFRKWLKHDDMDIAEIPIETALKYLNESKSPKRFNNLKSALSKIWTLLKPYSDLERNIWQDIPGRPNDSENYRPLSVKEYAKVIKSTDGEMRQAFVLGWYTGLRKEDVFGLQWADIKNGMIETVPGKTKRFKRAVRIPVHPKVKTALVALRNDSPHVFKQLHSGYNGGAFQERLRNIFDSCGIRSDSGGLVGFRSLRASFVTRCEEAGIPRHVVQGLVGHRSPMMTERYSHDVQSAKAIFRLD